MAPPSWRSLTSTLLVVACSATTLELHLHYPLSGLSTDEYVAATGDDTLFGVDFVSCFDAKAYGGKGCPGAEAVFTASVRITAANYIGNDEWVLALPIEDYSGPVYIDVYAPQAFVPTADSVYASTVKECTTPEIYEMGGEMCQQQGSAWTVAIGLVNVTVDIYPSFGVAAGSTWDLLPSLYSPQLNNTRNVSAYVPSSVTQNTVKRPVAIMILLDGSKSIVNTFANRGGFEAGQATGVVPESIMLGITTIEFALAGNFAQRSYELTYAEMVSDPDMSCDNGSPNGGTDSLLDWIDTVVIPAALEALGMERGEVSISGGSMGGLAACYAATKNPDVFARAVCMSLTNCFNFGIGGLAPVISSNFGLSGGKAPKAVMQFMGAEGVVELWGKDNETQFDFLAKDEAAWRGAGLVPMAWGGQTEDAMFPGAAFGYAALAPAPDHAIMSLILPGGQHAQTTWEREFAFALNHLYRPGPSGSLRAPITETVRYISPTIASVTSRTGL